VEGAEFLQKYCIYLGEFLDNPAKLAHEWEYEAHNLKADPVGALLASLKRHFEDHKEGKAQEWVAFKREPGEELPTMLFRLQGLALDLEKSLSDQELVVKFVTALDRRLGEQTSTQAIASTLQSGGAYTLDEAYEAALMVSAANSRLRIARELLPRAGGTDPARPRWGPRAPAGAHAAMVERAPMAAAAAPLGGEGGSGACHNCGGQGHYRSSCPYPSQKQLRREGPGAQRRRTRKGPRKGVLCVRGNWPLGRPVREAGGPSAGGSSGGAGDPERQRCRVCGVPGMEGPDTGGRCHRGGARRARGQ
jgi:hypothetical protein